ncbi:MAG: hypothetical protein JW927_18685 [Deltaproteobacteria bacterium]|nr:hypothetical protein [Deltaproteobacteria bacterium]
MKTAVFTILFLVYSGFAWAQTSIDAFGDSILFSKPNEKVWTLVKEVDPGEGTKGIRVFKHEKITGDKGVSTEPAISLIFEEVPKSMNAAAYALKGIEDIEKSLKITWSLLGGYPDYSSDQHSIVYKARYIKSGIPHRVYLCYILYNNTGVVIIADSAEDVFKQVDEDMLAFIKSVVIRS